MILKIVILILLIEIIAGKPVKPPPKNDKPAPKRKLPQDSNCPKKMEILKKVFKKPPPDKKPPPKKGGKRSFWDPPIPAVKCQPGRTPQVFLGYPDPDSPVYPEYPENPDNPDYPGFPDYPGRPYKNIR